jgi:hypothetical protein
MSTPNDIIDMFADLHKSIYREVGTLMGRVLEGRIAAPVVAAPVVAESVTDTNLEVRIMKAIDDRFAALEKAITASRLSGQKRKQPDTPPSEDDEDEEEEAPTSAPASAPQRVEASKPQNDEAVNELVKGLATTKITDTTPAVVKKQEVEATSPDSSVVEEEVEATSPDGSAEEEEDDNSEQQSDAADEEEEEALTPFKYKGKDYYMDGECQVYAVDADGELIEDPVGIYDEKTRRITFNN